MIASYKIHGVTILFALSHQTTLLSSCFAIVASEYVCVCVCVQKVIYHFVMQIGSW